VAAEEEAAVAAEVKLRLDQSEIPAYVKRRFWLEKAPHLTKAEVDLVFEELKNFLFLSYTNKDTYLFSFVVDEAWHTFILFTREYMTFCNNVFNKYMHHSPSISRGGYSDDIQPIRNMIHIIKSQMPKSKLINLDTEFKISGSKFKKIISIEYGEIFLDGLKIS